MKSWLIAISILIIQEVVLFNGLLLKTYQGAFPIIIITIIFLLATVFDIAIGFYFGKYLKNHWRNKKLIEKVKNWSENFQNLVGTKGRRVALFLLGYFSFPYLNGLIASWLNFPVKESFLYIFLGNVFSYIVSLAIIGGLGAIIGNTTYLYIGVLAFSAIFILIGNRFSFRWRKL